MVEPKGRVYLASTAAAMKVKNTRAETCDLDAVFAAKSATPSPSTSYPPIVLFLYGNVVLVVDSR